MFLRKKNTSDMALWHGNHYLGLLISDVCSKDAADSDKKWLHRQSSFFGDVSSWRFAGEVAVAFIVVTLFKMALSAAPLICGICQ